MTHELKKIIANYLIAKNNGVKSVLATVVALDGSSYRRPGVRMLIDENGKMTGAVSGGCVEKEILRQAKSVFETNMAKVMTYDGRFRLGCEGVLYILIEIFDPIPEFIDAFYNSTKERNDISLCSYFSKKIETSSQFGTTVKFNDVDEYSISKEFNSENDTSSHLKFEQTMKPCFKLIIIGAEHDAVQLCTYASLAGWEVTIVAPISDSKTIENFPGAHELINIEAADIEINDIDSQTAIVLMTHSFVNDLKYLIALKDAKPIYLGLLGPSKRREKLLQAFLEHYPEVNDQFFDVIHGPAGLNIGAETPQEIAISIVSEILTITRKQDSRSLKNKSGNIHSHHSEVKW